MRAAAPVLLGVALLAGPTPPLAAERYNWDAIGAEFCRLTLAGDLAGMGPILTPSLAGLIEAAAVDPAVLPVRMLFQSYTNAMPVCEAHTRNVALVEIRRSTPGGTPAAWLEYLVIVPETDGTTRIDDVLFATRRSDTLRARLGALVGLN